MGAGAGTGRGVKNGGFVREVTVRIPEWLYKAAVCLLLLYRRVRYGYSFRRIPLTQGKFAIVDAGDYGRLSQYNWQAHKDGYTYYARRSRTEPVTGRRTTVPMHREILDVGVDKVVDHINGNGLDNRSVNLRAATTAQNCMNRRLHKKKSSPYRGVSFNRQLQKYVAYLGYKGNRMYLGCFDNEIAAAKAYDKAAKKYHKDFAGLNFQ